MSISCVRVLMFALLVTPAAAAAQESMAPKGPMTLAATLAKGYQSIEEGLSDAAAKMPEEHYAFRPTPEIKPFGQLVSHLALAQFRDCAVLKGEPSPKKDEKEETTRSKADALALLKASIDYCAPLVSAFTDSTMTEMTKYEQTQVAKGLIPTQLVVHGMEMYGTMAVYLRLKGIVPPMTEKEMKMKKSQ
jgi:uncharacterized damage-inducible protein DinB